MEKTLVYRIKTTGGVSVIIEKDTDTYYVRWGSEEKYFLTAGSEKLVLQCILVKKEITPEDRNDINKRIEELEKLEENIN
jgi:hypothetical protein